MMSESGKLRSIVSLRHLSSREEKRLLSREPNVPTLKDVKKKWMLLCSHFKRQCTFPSYSIKSRSFLRNKTRIKNSANTKLYCRNEQPFIWSCLKRVREFQFLWRTWQKMFSPKRSWGKVKWNSRLKRVELSKFKRRASQKQHTPNEINIQYMWT